MGRYGAFAYSESAAYLGYSSQYHDPEAARQEALANCSKADAAILCCECDCWLAFALSDSAGGYAWVARGDGPTAAADALAECRKACGASDVRLLACYSTNNGEEYAPEPPRQPARRGKVPTGFLVVWGLFSLGALGAGLWMLSTALAFHANHVEAEGTVVLRSDSDPTRPGPRGKRHPYVEFRADEQTFVVRSHWRGSGPTPAKFREGNRVRLWYPAGNPPAAQFEGDRGLYAGGIGAIVFGGLFTLLWLLMLVARVFPKGPVQVVTPQGG